MPGRHTPSCSSRSGDIGRGRHTGTAATVEHLYGERISELRRKGRSPNAVYGYERVYERNIRPTLGKLAADEGEYQDTHRPLRRPSVAGPIGSEHLSDPCLHLVDVHPGVSMGLARHQPGAMGGTAGDPERRTGRADAGGGPPADRGSRAVEAAGVRPSDPRRGDDRAATGRALRRPGATSTGNAAY